MASASKPSPEHELVIVRVFQAPRELVFAAWTQPGHLAHWSGPRGFTTPHHAMDLRPGGRYRVCLRSPEGVDHWLGGTYLEIEPPSRLVMTHAWEDEGGRPGPETRITVSLAEDGPGRTRMEFRQTGFGSQASRDGHRGGWTSSFDVLDEYLEGRTA